MTAGTDGSRAVAALLERMDPAAKPRLEAGEYDGIPYLTAKLPGPYRLLFTTRVGGESRVPYASLNLSPRFDDDPEAVTRNRARVAQVLSYLSEADSCPAGAGDAAAASQAAPHDLVSPLQVHGLRVVGAAEYHAESQERAGRGEEWLGCDGLTLHSELDRGLAPTLLFADCVPVILAGEVDVAVLHGGWRGVLDGIVDQGARAMTGPPGMAFIGPSVGPCCFSVSAELAESFADRFGRQVVVGPENGPHVDLWAAVEVALAEVGVPAHQVVNPRLCTVCNRDLFFSFRGEEITGRQGAVAWAVPRS